MRSLALLKIGCETNVSSSRFERRITSERCYKVERNLFYKELSKVKRYLKDFKLDIPFIEDAIYEMSLIFFQIISFLLVAIVV